MFPHLFDIRMLSLVLGEGWYIRQGASLWLGISCINLAGLDVLKFGSSFITCHLLWCVWKTLLFTAVNTGKIRLLSTEPMLLVQSVDSLRRTRADRPSNRELSIGCLWPWTMTWLCKPITGDLWTWTEWLCRISSQLTAPIQFWTSQASVAIWPSPLSTFLPISGSISLDVPNTQIQAKNPNVCQSEQVAG